ncbi:MAG: hypothetical protein ACJA2W_001643 [Planctomycetota bacterium]|jgi:hypothetical protein
MGPAKRNDFLLGGKNLRDGTSVPQRYPFRGDANPGRIDLKFFQTSG